MQQDGTATRSDSRRIRALLVEPDPQWRTAIELELSVRGQVVVACSDTATALAAFKDNIFHLVYISQRLPDRSGTRLCDDLRQLPGGEDVVIVSVAEHADATTTEETGALCWSNDASLRADQLEQIEQITWRRFQPNQRLAHASSEPFLVLNPNGTVRFAAPVADRLLGFPPAALTGVNAFSFFHADDAPQLLSMLTESFTHPSQTRAIEARIRRDGDAWQTISISARNKTSDPDVQGIVVELRGPEVSVGVADQVTRTAMHDRVTDLPNQNLFVDRVDHAIARSTRSQQPVVVMAIDFNAVAVDDSLIVAFAQRLRSCLRSSDTAARLGPSLFGVLLEDIGRIDHVSIVAERIVHAMSVPFYSDGTEQTLTPRIGVSINTSTRQRAVELVRDATIANAWARIQGAGSHVLFDPSMQPPTDEPITNQFEMLDAPAGPEGGINDRFEELRDRIASIEQALARIVPTRP